MKKAKNLILSGIVLVGFVLAIIGLFIAYLKTTGQVTGTTYSTTLFDNNFFTDASDLSRSVLAFAIMTVIFAGLTLIFNALQLLGVMKDNRVKILTSVLSVVCAIIAFVLICVLANDNDLSTSIFNISVGLKMAPAVGAYLLSIGGIVAGLFGVFSVARKKKRK